MESLALWKAFFRCKAGEGFFLCGGEAGKAAGFWSGLGWLAG